MKAFIIAALLLTATVPFLACADICGKPECANNSANNTASNVHGRPSGTSAWSGCVAHANIRSNAA